MIEGEVFAQEQAFDAVAIYNLAAAHKWKGGGISIRTSRSNIKVVGKAFAGEVVGVIKQVLDY
jgi:putative N-acetylmannosamine-6-phosphate epimerase